jgi:diaminopimelate decarboxylase
MDTLNHLSMDHLRRIGNKQSLYIGGVSVAELATRFGTPLYIYDFDRIRERADAISGVLAQISKSSRAFFAMKSQSNLSILKLINSRGLGMDVVSGGEIERARAAGVPGQDIIFSGVAKSESEIRLGLQENIASFNIESPHEVELLKRLSSDLGRQTRVCLRINPNVDGNTHSKINTGLAETKFGLSPELAKQLTLEIIQCKHLRLTGVSCHIGSQIFDLNTVKLAALSMKNFARELLSLGAPLDHIDMGGGLGVPYHQQEVKQESSFTEWVNTARMALPDSSFSLRLEPGRSIVADAGILVTKILDLKPAAAKTFAIVDAGMTELLRPAMYDAYHEAVPVDMVSKEAEYKLYDIVGPVCETSCWLAAGRSLPKLERLDLIAILTAGAYGMTMASNYNCRPRPAEVAVSNGQFKLIRKREQLQAIWDDELSCLDPLL